MITCHPFPWQPSWCLQKMIIILEFKPLISPTPTHLLFSSLSFFLFFVTIPTFNPLC